MSDGLFDNDGNVMAGLATGADALVDTCGAIVDPWVSRWALKRSSPMRPGRAPSGCPAMGAAKQHL